MLADAPVDGCVSMALCRCRLATAAIDRRRRRRRRRRPRPQLGSLCASIVREQQVSCDAHIPFIGAICCVRQSVRPSVAAADGTCCAIAGAQRKRASAFVSLARVVAGRASSGEPTRTQAARQCHCRRPPHHYATFALFLRDLYIVCVCECECVFALCVCVRARLRFSSTAARVRCVRSARLSCRKLVVGTGKARAPLAKVKRALVCVCVFLIA